MLLAKTFGPAPVVDLKQDRTNQRAHSISSSKVTGISRHCKKSTQLARSQLLQNQKENEI